MTKRTRYASFSFGLLATSLLVSAAVAAPVPGYVPPVEQTQAPAYADDTRGVYVPKHLQHRMKSANELDSYDVTSANKYQRGMIPVYAQDNPNVDAYERTLNTISNGYGNMDNELNRIAGQGGQMGMQQEYQVAQNYNYGSQPPVAQQPYGGGLPPMQAPMQQQPYGGGYNQGPQGLQPVMPMPQNVPNMGQPSPVQGFSADGMEVATGEMVTGRTLDMTNSLVRLNEDRISIRRALQRMMDQIGGSDWAVVWDLDNSNAGLPDEEISIRAEEPFVNVLNALLGRMQSRSGQPLRVIRYDRTKRLVITDRVGGTSFNGGDNAGPAGEKVAVTEQVLKESMVTLHYDMIPLVDALENIVNQAGKGEWRLRIYAGKDKVLEPAHVEEPFSVAMDRLLKLFNLKYEIFPGGKLIVVTHNTRFGYRGQ